MMDASPADRRPFLAAFTTFLLWGTFPLLFQAAGRAGANPWEIVAWRTIFAVPLCLVLVAHARQGRALAALFLRPREVGALMLSGLLLGVNWSTYIVAVSSGHTLAASLGYFINPLMNVAAGALLFRERMGRPAQVALGLAAAGVVVQTAAAGGAPWVALILAGSFCAYSVIRKRTVVEASTALAVECLVLLVPAIGYAAFMATHDGAFGSSLAASTLLALGGPATVIPLMLFGYAARRTSLAVIGFLQFITPSMLFVLGAVQGEPLNRLTLASFALIWGGVAVFAWDGWRKRNRPSPFTEAD